MSRPLKIGLFGIGLKADWDQFEGLEQSVVHHVNQVEKKTEQQHGQIVN